MPRLPCSGAPVRRLLPVAAFLAAFAGLAVPSAGAGAQEADPQEAPRATVVVRQVAGTSIYLDVGRRHGLETGDTIEVAREEGGDPVGRLVVTAATDTRSVLTFAAEPFPITRGASLTLTLLRAPAEAVPEAAAPRATVTADARSPAPQVSSFSPGPHGRIGLDLSASQSTTSVGSVDPERVRRTFATPALRFDATVPQAVGSFALHLGGRLAYRYADGATIAPATSVRIYGASLDRDVPGSPIRLRLGRFHSPVEVYSGWWDGAMIRVGNRAFGVGALAGYEPDRWNERPSADRPKVTAFADWHGRGPGWRWQGDVSFHTVRPRDSLPDHTFLGISQRISTGPLRISQDLQVDRDEAGGRWRVSRAGIRSTLTLGRHVDVRAGASRRESWLVGLGGGLFAPRSDRIDGGIAIRTGGSYLSADASRSKDGLGRESTGLTGSVSVRRLPASSVLGASAVVSRWTGPYGNTLSANPSLMVDLTPAWLRFGYRYYRSAFLERTSTTHGAEASLDAPLASGLRVSVRARVQWGSYLANRSLDLSLYRIF